MYDAERELVVLLRRPVSLEDAWTEERSTGPTLQHLEHLCLSDHFMSSCAAMVVDEFLQGQGERSESRCVHKSDSSTSADSSVHLPLWCDSTVAQPHDSSKA